VSFVSANSDACVL